MVPKGTNFYGHVTQSRPSGRFKGRAVLGLKLDSLELDVQEAYVSYVHEATGLGMST